MEYFGLIKLTTHEVSNPEIPVVLGGRDQCLYPQVAFNHRRWTDIFSVHQKVEIGPELQIQGGRLQFYIKKHFPLKELPGNEIA